MQMPSSSSFVMEFSRRWDHSHRVEKCLCNRRCGIGFLRREIAEWILPEFREHRIEQPNRGADILAAVVDFFSGHASRGSVIEFSRNLELPARAFEAQAL